MEKLTLTCGRFIPPRGGDTAQRVERLEVYLSKLTQDLELLVKEMNGITAELTAIAVDGEEGDA